MQNQEKLPLDMMMEIFSRLPARTVGRFWTLSKQYCSLLSQPWFIKNHLLHATTFKLIVHTIQTNPKRHQYVYYPLHNNNLTCLDYSCDEFVGDADYPSVLGSCNGLLLWMINWDAKLLTLWNPTTKESDCLPKFPDDKFGCSRERFHYNYSFGYDSVNDDYKIVCVVCVSMRDYSYKTSLSNTIYIYSHRRRCWKEIEPPFTPYCVEKESDNGQFVHGKFHWAAYTSLDKNCNQRSQSIVSLDLATEEFGTVPQPPSDHGSTERNVCVLGGKLCFYINSCYMYRRGFEIWIMREYGVDKSWFLLLTIPLHNLHHVYFHCTCVPLFMMKSGEILLKAYDQFKESICLYNPKDDSSTTVNTVCYNACLTGHTYVESLVNTSSK